MRRSIDLPCACYCKMRLQISRRCHSHSEEKKQVQAYLFLHEIPMREKIQKIAMTSVRMHTQSHTHPHTQSYQHITRVSSMGPNSKLLSNSAQKETIRKEPCTEYGCSVFHSFVTRLQIRQALLLQSEAEPHRTHSCSVLPGTIQGHKSGHFALTLALSSLVS